MPRAFLAVTIPLAVRQTLVQCRDAYLRQDPSWAGEKWVAEENLHVTLRFLGDVPEPACRMVAERASHTLSEVAPYRLRLDIVRAVPRPRSASLLWIAPSQGADDTLDLARRMEHATSFLDFDPDNHSFRAHVTLVRARRPRRVSHEALDEMERCLSRAGERSVAMSVRDVTLFASTLTPRGPIYDEMAVIPLGG